MKPKYAIVNEIDAPIARHIAQLTPIGYCYMSRNKDGYLKKFDGMKPVRPTPIEDFGFAVMERGKTVTFVRCADCVATYSDGLPRRWHDDFKQIVWPKVTKRKASS